jgi:hypothetical protein
MKAALRSLWLGIVALFARRRLEAEMAEEMRAHLDALTEEYLVAGMSESEA